MKLIKSFLFTSILIMNLSIFIEMPLNQAHAGEDLESMRARIPKIIELKSKGSIGERADGYLGVVNASDPEAAAIVSAENADRKSVYQDRASKQGVSLEQFAGSIGDGKVQKAKSSGQPYMGTDGSWHK